MSLILLFDLDNTLIKNSMSRFIPAYLDKLASFLNGVIPNSNSQIQSAILQGTEQMLSNIDPLLTLEEKFANYFYPALGVEKKDINSEINYFYKEIYPELQYVVDVIPAARNLLTRLAAKQVQMIIATNPLFPRMAILNRLLWADLGIPTDYFSLISSYESFHFAKPNPAFYAELLSKIGWSNTPIGMIGNDWEMDIIPAEKIGIPTFFFGQTHDKNTLFRHSLSGNGDWQELSEWISHLDNSTYQLEPHNTLEVLNASLLATAAFIDSLLRDLSTINFWHKKPSNKDWSLVEIISHIADVDSEVNLPRIELFRQNDKPFFPAIETDNWAEERDYIHNDPGFEMFRFISNRKHLCEIIATLTTAELEKPIQHTIFGPTDILEILKFITQHDRIHINQIIKTTAEIKRDF